MTVEVVKEGRSHEEKPINITCGHCETELRFLPSDTYPITRAGIFAYRQGRAIRCLICRNEIVVRLAPET